VGISVDSSASPPVSSSSPAHVLCNSAVVAASSIPSQTLQVSTDSVGVSTTSDTAHSDFVSFSAVPLLPSENHRSEILPLPNHVHDDVWNHDHFFIPCVLHFPGRKVIKTYAFVDCGASLSHISSSFTKEHCLPLRVKPVTIPIYTVDDRPLSSGSLTHDVVPLTYVCVTMMSFFVWVSSLCHTQFCRG
jgi:hypothetical protein